MGTVTTMISPSDTAEQTPEVAEAPAETATVETETVSDTDPFDNAEVDTFDRAYVEKLRSEAASHRTKLKEAEGKLSPMQPFLDAGMDSLLVDIFSGDEASSKNAFDYLVNATGFDMSHLQAVAEELDGEDVEELTPEKIAEITKRTIQEERDAATKAADRQTKLDTWNSVSEVLESDDSLKLLDIDGKKSPNPAAAMVLAMAENAGAVTAESVQEQIRILKDLDESRLEEARKQAVADFVAGKRVDAESSPSSPGPAGEITAPSQKPVHKMSKQERIELLQARQSNAAFG